MWKLEITFENEETIIFRGDDQDIPLTTAVRYYNLFVKEAKGRALYKKSENSPTISLTEKILQLTKN